MPFLPTPRRAPALPEFIALMAMMSAMVAFSIDAMLPALPAIAAELTPTAPNRAQLVVGAFLLALGLGTLVIGPLSDRFGRRPVLTGGLAVYLLGAAAAANSQSLTGLLAARILQGLGCAAPRVIAMAIARDLYAGRKMARIMSFISIVFALVPALAPSVGALITAAYGWRAIYLAFMLFTLAVGGWFLLRQPETLPPEARRPFRPARLWLALREIFAHATTRLSIAVMALASGMLFATLTSVQPIFDVAYGQAARFPLYFGAIAIFATSAGFINARLVERLGMRRMVRSILAVQVGLSAGMIAVTLWLPVGPLSFGLFVVWTFSLFFQAGMTMGNLNALALEAMGHIAGLASSVVSAVATIGALLVAVPLGLAFDGTPRPLAMGVLGMAALGFWLTGRIKRPVSAGPDPAASAPRPRFEQGHGQ